MNTHQHQNIAQDTAQLAEAITVLEWNAFQNTTNEGGRANCQDNWHTFRIMRMSQFTCWPISLLESYHEDLMRANEQHRNLITEKYAWMMASTDPLTFERNLQPYLPTLSKERQKIQERIIAIQLTWAEAFRAAYPHLAGAMRVLHTTEDTSEVTSFETYLRGELNTYSDNTLGLYAAMIEELRQTARNLTQEIIEQTVHLYGYHSLEEAERLQANDEQ